MKEEYVILRKVPRSRESSKGTGSGSRPPVDGYSLSFESGDPGDHGNENFEAAAPAGLPMKLAHPSRKRFDAAPKFSKAEKSVRLSADLSMLGVQADGFSGKGAVVAILDSGIDLKHEAFDDVREQRLLCKDFTKTSINDTDGHGTILAAKIVGREKDGVRYSVAPNIDKLLVGKIWERDQKGFIDNLCSGVFWAVEEGAHIISVSLGIDFGACVQSLKEQKYPSRVAISLALERYGKALRVFETLADHIEARRPGTLLVAAAGNHSKRRCGDNWVVPAALPAVVEKFISVGALARCRPNRDVSNSAAGDKYLLANFSNMRVDCLAPGTHIVSADLNQGYAILSGTSVSAAIVAGIAALWCEHSLETRWPPLLRNQLLENCCALPDMQMRDVGRGTVQAPRR